MEGFADEFQMYDLLSKPFRPTLTSIHSSIWDSASAASRAGSRSRSIYTATIVVRQGLDLECACMGTVLHVPLLDRGAGGRCRYGERWLPGCSCPQTKFQKSGGLCRISTCDVFHWRRVTTSAAFAFGHIQPRFACKGHDLRVERSMSTICVASMSTRLESFAGIPAEHHPRLDLQSG